MTDYVKQYAIVVGPLRYPVKTAQGIDYMTGTRIYRVHSLNKHIPRLINLFRRQIKCVYTSQPEYQEQLEKKKKRRQREQRYNDLISQNNSSDTTSIMHSDSDTHSENESDTQSQDDIIENQNDEENQTNNQPYNENIENLNDNQSTINQPNNQPENEHTQIEKELQQNTNPKQGKPAEQQNKTKRQVNQHIPNNTNNITRRKRKNSKNKHPDEIWIDNLPLELTNQNYPPLQQNKKTNKYMNNKI